MIARVIKFPIPEPEREEAGVRSAGASPVSPSPAPPPAPRKKRVVSWDDESVVPRRRRGSGGTSLSLLNEREGLLLSLIDGETPLVELMDLPYLNGEEKREAMRSLAKKRLIELVSREDIARERREIRVLEHWLNEEAAALDGGTDYFTFFGVFPDSSPAHLRHACYKKTRMLDPARFKKFRSLQPRAAALQRRILEAYETLADPVSRRAHTAAFVAEAKAAKDAPPPEMARHAFREALYWWERGQMPECVMLIETARASFPNDATYLLFAARAMAANPDLASYAERYFLRAADADPTLIEAHLGLAFLALARGDRDGAHTRLLAAAALDATHPDVLRLEAETERR